MRISHLCLFFVFALSWPILKANATTPNIQICDAALAGDPSAFRHREKMGFPILRIDPIYVNGKVLGTEEEIPWDKIPVFPETQAHVDALADQTLRESLSRFPVGSISYINLSYKKTFGGRLASAMSFLDGHPEGVTGIVAGYTQRGDMILHVIPPSQRKIHSGQTVVLNVDSINFEHSQPNFGRRASGYLEFLKYERVKGTGAAAEYDPSRAYVFRRGKKATTITIGETVSLLRGEDNFITGTFLGVTADGNPIIYPGRNERDTYVGELTYTYAPKFESILNLNKIDQVVHGEILVSYGIIGIKTDPDRPMLATFANGDVKAGFLRGFSISGEMIFEPLDRLDLESAKVLRGRVLQVEPLRFSFEYFAHDPRLLPERFRGLQRGDRIRIEDGRFSSAITGLYLGMYIVPDEDNRQHPAVIGSGVARKAEKGPDGVIYELAYIAERADAVKRTIYINPDTKVTLLGDQR